MSKDADPAAGTTSLRDGVLKAADHIEAHPEQFHFGSHEVPRNLNSRACVLGWIHFFSGIKGPISDDGGRELIDAGLLDCEMTSDSDFYDRITGLVQCSDWWFDRALCVQALRLYAKEYCH